MRIEMPSTDQEWERLAARLLRAHMGMAEVGTVELARRLTGMGLKQEASTISGKLTSGRFAATFFLQSLAALGVEELELRMRPARSVAAGRPPSHDGTPGSDR